jgi:hypothetical protein
MLKKSPFTKTGSPTALISETLTKTIDNYTQNHFDGSSDVIYKVHYVFEAYHVAVRTNKKVGLGFGGARYSFETRHPHVFEQYNNLDYAGLLQAVVNIPHRFNALYEDDFVCTYGVGSDMVWDGTSFWIDPDEDAVDLMTNVFPKLVTAYPNLPDVPAGADGWYKVRK